MQHQVHHYPKVIVAGMPRTGTESIKRALEVLYGNHARAYHMSEVLNRPKHLQVWSDLAFERIQPEQVNWQEFLAGYVATTDMPCALYFEQLAAAFPDAKIVLSLRDESEWFESYYRLLVSAYQFRFLRFLPPLNRFWPYSAKLHEILFGDAFTEQGPVREMVIDGYRHHNQRVRETISPERLLEYKVEQGWQPLCNFLELEEPPVQFPHLNAGVAGPRRIIMQAVQKLSITRLAITVGILLLILLIVLLVAR
jgi:Sulfotransferase domain